MLQVPEAAAMVPLLPPRVVAVVALLQLLLLLPPLLLAVVALLLQLLWPSGRCHRRWRGQVVQEGGPARAAAAARMAAWLRVLQPLPPPAPAHYSVQR